MIVRRDLGGPREYVTCPRAPCGRPGFWPLARTA